MNSELMQQVDAGVFVAVSAGIAYLLWVTFRRAHAPSPIEYNILGVSVRIYVLVLVAHYFKDDSAQYLAMFAALSGVGICVAQVVLSQSVVYSTRRGEWIVAFVAGMGLLIVLVVALGATAAMIESSGFQGSERSSAESTAVRDISAQIEQTNATLLSLRKSIDECPLRVATSCRTPLFQQLSVEQARLDALTKGKQSAMTHAAELGGGSSGAMVRLFMMVSKGNLDVRHARLWSALTITFFMEIFGMMMHMMAAFEGIVKTADASPRQKKSNLTAENSRSDTPQYTPNTPPHPHSEDNYPHDMTGVDTEGVKTVFPPVKDSDEWDELKLPPKPKANTGKGLKDTPMKSEHQGGDNFINALQRRASQIYKEHKAQGGSMTYQQVLKKLREEAGI